MDELKQAIADLGKAFEAHKEANTLRLKELADSNGVVSGELKEREAKIAADLDKFDEAKSKFERRLAAANDSLEESNKADDSDAEYKAGFNEYVRSGKEDGLRELGRKARQMGSLSDPDGGFWVSFDVDQEMQKDFVETSPVRQVARVQTIGSASLQGRRRTARAATGGWVGENASRPATDAPQLGTWEIFAREAYAFPEATQGFLEDASVNVESWLQGELVDEFSLLENDAFLNGDGVRKPRGLLTYTATDPGNGEFIQSIEATATNVIDEVDLINLQTQLKEPYQAGASWMLTRFTLAELRKITESSGSNFLWQPGLSAGIPSMILGRPYTVVETKLGSSTSTGMDSVGTTSGLDSEARIILAYGDFNKGYRIVDRRGINIVRDALTNKPFVGFYATKRVGADVVQHEAIKVMTNDDA